MLAIPPAMTAATLLRLLQPLLLMAVAVTVAIPLMVGAAIPMLAVLWVIGLAPMLYFRERRERAGITVAGYLVWGLLLPVLFFSAAAPTVALVFAAVLHFDAKAWPELHQLFAEAGLTMAALATLAMVTGIIGVSSTLVFAFIDIPWRLKQIRQVRALPRSKARSAAIGLAEFEGIARAGGGRREITPSRRKTAAPFHLDDGSGRILVDPREAAVRERSLAGESLALNEVEEGIRDGDRVYVIGNVQPREDAAPNALESERLVVRPLRQRAVDSPIARLLYVERKQPGDREAPNIFIVDKGREHNVTQRLRFVLWDYCVYIAVYMGASFWLVQAAWPLLPPEAADWLLPQ